ncbi:MAG: hypothetical protein ING66_09440 [Rhodocyclaceae bacterium]|nr:hypothetical protein [Rhodocyclaceae bacterium]MCA3082889.1 hypothetical protein [Rhodocyclaceae bacterium]
MKAIIFATYRDAEIVSGNAKTVMAAIADRADVPALKAEINLAIQTAFAVECSSAQVGNVSIAYEIKRGKPFFTLTERVQVASACEVDLGNVANFREAKDATKPFLPNLGSAVQISVEEASKNTRIATNGKIYYGGKQNPLSEEIVSASIPVLAFICVSANNGAGPLAALV